MGATSNDRVSLSAEDGLIEWPRTQTIESNSGQPSFQPQGFSESGAFEYTNFDQPDIVSLVGTEDLLQYIFPDPNYATAPIFVGQNDSAESGELSTNMVALDGPNAVDQSDENEPPALLRLNAMINESVSLPNDTVTGVK